MNLKKLRFIPIRIGLGLIMFGAAIFAAPWTLLILGIGGGLLFPRFYEAPAAGLIFDILFSQPASDKQLATFYLTSLLLGAIFCIMAGKKIFYVNFSLS